MKYTEQFFKFPIRIYDRFSAISAQKQEENMNIPTEGAWVSGWVNMPYEEIAYWSDFFDSEQGTEGVEKDGFLYTVVDTYSLGPFICTWPKEKFEHFLNKHVESSLKNNKESLEGLLEELKKHGANIELIEKNSKV